MKITPHYYIPNKVIWKKLRKIKKIAPTRSWTWVFAATTRRLNHWTIEALTCFTFYFLGCICATPKGACTVHPDCSFCNVDKTSQRKVFPKYDVFYNRSDRVYRNTWCNAGRQRTRHCTKDTSWNAYCIWRETNERSLLYGLGEPRSQFFWWRHGWGIPPYPPSDVILRHVTCVDSYYI